MRQSGLVLHVAEDYQAMSQLAAEMLARQIRQKPDLLLCLATGSSPKRLYELLAQQTLSGRISCDRLRVLKLDEWGGLPMDDPRTCEWYLQTHFLQPMQIAPHRYIGFQSDATDPQAECRRIEQWLAESGPIDLCVLGLGINGHLGLNEPGPILRPESHAATLSPATLGHAMLQGSQHPPRYGLTLGMAQIMHARQILLLVHGRHKAEPLKKLFSREISCQFPASILWMHPSVSCVCDREAAAQLLP